jgi:beta-phosphoglucomutase
MRALHAIIFDFDGVIADSERLHLRSYQQVLGKRSLPLTDATYLQDYLGYGDDVATFRRYARNRGLAWDEPEIQALVAEKTRVYDELASRGEMLFPGAAQFIRDAAAHVPIAIASGALSHEIEAILERADLRPLFGAIIGADRAVRCKPSPDPYLEAFHALRAAGHDIRQAHTVAIEDSTWGLVAARAAGLRCVAVTNTCAADELAPHAELIVHGLEALTLDALDTLVLNA